MFAQLIFGLFFLGLLSIMRILSSTETLSRHLIRKLSGKMVLLSIANSVNLLKNTENEFQNLPIRLFIAANYLLLGDVCE